MTTTPGAQGPTTLVLQKPVIHGGETIAELTFGEFQAGWLEDAPAAMEKFSVGDVLRIAARASGQPYAVLKKLGTKDLHAVAETVATFFDDGPQDGGAS